MIIMVTQNPQAQRDAVNGIHVLIKPIPLLHMDFERFRSDIQLVIYRGYIIWHVITQQVVYVCFINWKKDQNKH